MRSTSVGTSTRAGAMMLVGSLAAAACSEPLSQPDLRDGTVSFATIANLASEGSTATNYFVVFNGKIPRRFDAAVGAAGGEIEATYDDVGVAVVSGLDEVTAAELKKSSGAQFVELEPVISQDEPAGMTEPLSAGASTASASDPTTAFFYPSQWNMRAIEADRAWAAGRLGSSSTTVAILDTGIDYLHNDLAGRVDLSRSVSFVPSDDALVAAFFPGRHVITDLRFHGTHVASTVASNGIGMAGVTSGVTLIGVKVCSVFGSCPGSSIVAGVAYATAIGADVANMSLGGSFTKSDFPGFVSTIQRLFNSANRAGMTIVVSAGNSSADLDHDGNGFKTYCNAANVVCVSATGPTSGSTFGPGPFIDPDTPAFFTNFGRSAISVAAPGGNVTFVIGACSTASLFEPICQTSPSFYLGVRGTSMSAPHTSGVAALIREDVGRRPGRIRQRLHQSADDLGQRGTDPFYGKGRINAGSAVGAN